MRRRALILAFVASVPIAFVAFVSLIQWIPRFSDPCFEWGTARRGDLSTHNVRKGQLGSAVLPPGGLPIRQAQNPCANRISATSETRAQAAKRLIIVPGGLLVASALGLFGVLRSIPLLTAIGSAILVLESIAAIFTLAPLLLTAAILLLLAARQTRLATNRFSASSA